MKIKSNIANNQKNPDSNKKTGLPIRMLILKHLNNEDNSTATSVNKSLHRMVGVGSWMIWQ